MFLNLQRTVIVLTKREIAVVCVYTSICVCWMCVRVCVCVFVCPMVCLYVSTCVCVRVLHVFHLSAVAALAP